MAEEVRIGRTDARGKLRDPLGIIGLAIITLGIYSLVWYYKVNKEMAELGRERNNPALGTSPGTSLLAITLGAFVIVPAFVSAYNTCKRLSAMEAESGVPEGMHPALLFLLYLCVSPVGAWIFQNNMNGALKAQAGAAVTAPAAAALA